MKHINMRATIMSTAIIGSLAASLTACGGGSTPSTSAPVSTTPGTGGALSPITTNNFTGPSSTITVSIAKTPHTASASAVSGARMSASAVRTASQSIRTAAAANRRSPAFVDSSTEYMEFVLLSGSTVLVDDVTYCEPQASQCSASFVVPVGTGYTASLFLYDGNPYMLSAGTVSNVSVVTGTNPTLTIPLSGVVSYFNVTTTANTFYGGVAQPSFTVSVSPLDSDQTIITNPSNTTAPLVDGNLNRINTVSLVPTAEVTGYYVTPTDVSPASATTLTPSSSLTFPATTYAYTGTGSETNIQWSATANTGSSPITTTGATGPYGYGWYNYGTASGSLVEPVTGPELTWVAEYTQTLTSPQYENNGSTTDATYAALEFPLAANTGSYKVGLLENVPFTGNITLTDNGQCGGIIGAYAPVLGTYSYATLKNSPYLTLTMNSSAASSTCIVTATDNASPPRQASLTIDVDNTSIVISNKARTNR